MVKTEKKRVRFVDTTLRDAHQSLWATRMRTKDILGILEAVDDAGGVSWRGGARYESVNHAESQCVDGAKKWARSAAAEPCMVGRG